MIELRFLASRVEIHSDVNADLVPGLVEDQH